MAANGIQKSIDLKVPVCYNKHISNKHRAQDVTNKRIHEVEVQGTADPTRDPGEPVRTSHP